MADMNRPTDVVVVEKSGGGVAMVLVVLLLIVAGIGLYLYNENNRSNIVRNDAITHAVKQVGNAAQDVGDSAKSNP